VLDVREGVVEAVEQLAPALVLGRAPEPLRMTLQGVPPDEQKVSIGDLDAAPQLVPLVPGREERICWASRKAASKAPDSPRRTFRIATSSTMVARIGVAPSTP
jgi:hypothetical protein